MITKETTIDGFKVSTTKHPPLRGLQLKARVLKIVLPALGALGAAGASFGDVARADLADPKMLAQLEPACEKLAQAIDPDALPALICELLSGTTIIVPDAQGVLNRLELGTPASIDHAFGGARDALLIRTCIFAAGVNFADFFGEKASASSSGSASPAAPGALSST